MHKRILVIYYTQTGQTLKIIQSLIKPFEGADELTLVFEAIRPVPEFPFPWNSKAFFQAMPESVQGLGCAIAPMEIQPGENFDLVILAWQAWFLSPSLPIQGWLQSASGQALLKGKPVITITGCRNMWVMALQDIKQSLAVVGAKHLGNIALRDKAPNLLSVFSIARWLFYNQKEKSGLIPRAGVSEQDIARCREFGESIKAALLQDDLTQLQPALIRQGAVEVLPGLVALEKGGKKMFGLWSKFVRRKGNQGDPARNFRLKLFEIYLYVVLFILSPISFVVFKMLFWVAPHRFKRIVEQYQAI